MPVLVPIVAAGAGYFATGAVVGSMALGTIASVTVGVAVGAVVGAAVSAIGTLVTGGDLKENALTGAFAGALFATPLFLLPLRSGAGLRLAGAVSRRAARRPVERANC